MKKILITVNSRYGSGGAEIGKLLAEHYGITLYDRKLIDETAKSMGFDPGEIEHIDESASSLLYSLSMNAYSMNGVSHYTHVPVYEKYYRIQCEIIKNAAKNDSAVFIGRCSDYILKDDFRIFSVYICAPIDFRINRTASLENIDNVAARKRIAKADKKRSSNYSFRVGESIYNADNYNLCVNTALCGIDHATQIIIDAVDRFYS